MSNGLDDYRFGFKAGAASRDAEVAEYMLERTIRKATEQSNIKLIAERDQLSELTKHTPSPCSLATTGQAP